MFRVLNAVKSIESVVQTHIGAGALNINVFL